MLQHFQYSLPAMVLMATAGSGRLFVSTKRTGANEIDDEILSVISTARNFIVSCHEGDYAVEANDSDSSDDTGCQQG